MQLADVATEATSLTLRPLTRQDYLPIADHGLIGDGRTAALVGRDGAVSWMCLPRFDSPPVFCRILDAARGGAFVFAPEDLVASRQRYVEGTGVLVTQMRCPTGVVELTDALLVKPGADLKQDVAAHRCALLRSVRVLEGHADLTIRMQPRGGARVEPCSGGLRMQPADRPDLHLFLHGSRPLSGAADSWRVRAGQQEHLLLRWGPDLNLEHAPEFACGPTIDAWRRWVAELHYEGPEKALVVRSAITLKLLDHFQNGAILAAPTSSLPECIGGERNWDYRFSWIRDAAFSVYALHRIGMSQEAAGFLTWVLDSVERHGWPRVLYDLEGEIPGPEQIDEGLEGYRGSAPVRFGNAAAEQRQHDVLGEILDCAYQRAHKRDGRVLSQELWRGLRALADAAADEWKKPDHGIWEVRTPGRTFTYSAALCHVALDRAARLAHELKLEGDVQRWRADAETIRSAILRDAWSSELESLTEHLGGGALDASLLALPLRRVLSARHPRMVATTAAIERRLGAGGGLLYRYLPDESPDGMSGHEGAFVLCSFWLVDNLALQGRVEEASELYRSLCLRVNDLGLLAEQIDPTSGAFLGNFPQALSHVGLISSGVTLARAAAAQRS